MRYWAEAKKAWERSANRKKPNKGQPTLDLIKERMKEIERDVSGHDQVSEWEF